MTNGFRRRRTRGLPGPVNLLAGGVILWTICFLLTGDHLSPVRLGVYMAPMIMVLAAVLAVWAVVWRVRSLAIVLSAVASGLFLAQAPPLMRAIAAEAPPHTADTVTVLSLSNRTMNQDMAATARMLRGENADLAILQEVADPGSLAKALDALPGPSLYSCSHGPYMIVSRFSVGTPKKGVWHGAVICDVALPSGPVAVASVHLPRAVRSSSDQNRVIHHLLEVLASIETPKIVAGDFNATPLTTPIRRIEATLSNAFTQAGRGFGFTFPTPARRIGAIGPFLTIDYIFHSADFTALSAEVLGTHPEAADHFPLRAVLRPNKATIEGEQS